MSNGNSENDDGLGITTAPTSVAMITTSIISTSTEQQHYGEGPPPNPDQDEEEIVDCQQQQQQLMHPKDEPDRLLESKSDRPPVNSHSYNLFDDNDVDCVTNDDGMVPTTFDFDDNSSFSLLDDDDMLEDETLHQRHQEEQEAENNTKLPQHNYKGKIASKMKRPDGTESVGGGFESSESQEDEDDVDKILARDLQGLSVEKRNQAMLDLHGIVELRPEDPDEMARLLKEMEIEVKAIIARITSRIPEGGPGSFPGPQQRIPYTVAEEQSYEYVHNTKFRMMFIRADRYDAKKAAARLIKFFEVKQTLFGDDRLCKKIKLEDLLDSDAGRASVEAGYCPQPRYRDATGRPIFVVYCERRPPNDVTTSLIHGRINFYTFMNVVENDEDAQRRGVVWLLLGMNCNPKSGSQKVREALPVYFGGIHLTFYNGPIVDDDSNAGISTKNDSTAVSVSSSITSKTPSEPTFGSAQSTPDGNRKNPPNTRNSTSTNESSNGVVSFQPWKKSVKETFTVDYRVRLRQHHGTEPEILRDLATFGIPHQAAKRVVSNEIHWKWLHEQLRIEQTMKKPVPEASGCTEVEWMSHKTTPTTRTDVSILNQHVDRQTRVSVPMPLNTPEDQFIDTTFTGYDVGHAGVKPTPTSFIRPMPDDVLFGLSKNIKNHPGNVRFRQLVSMNMGAYYSLSSTRTTKAYIAKVIVKELTRSGGRFLKKRGNEDITATNRDGTTNKNDSMINDVEEIEEWVEVDHKEAQKKCAHHFRNRWKALKKAPK